MRFEITYLVTAFAALLAMAGCQASSGGSVGTGQAGTAVQTTVGQKVTPPVAQKATPQTAVGAQHPPATSRMIRVSANGYVTAHHPEWRSQLSQPMHLTDKKTYWEASFGRPGQKQLVVDMKKGSYEVFHANMR